MNNTVVKQENLIASLYDKLETQLNALESLGVTSDKYAAMLYPLVESALPDEVLKTWQRIRSQKTIHQVQNVEEDQLKPLMQFLRAEVDSEMRLNLARAGMYGDTEWKDSILQIKNGEATCFFCKKSGHTGNKTTISSSKEMNNVEKSGKKGTINKKSESNSDKAFRK